MKNKFGTTIILVITFLLAGVAIFTAVRLYQLRQTSITPTQPESRPAAQQATTAPVAASACVLTFALSSASPTPTTTGTATATGTATSTATATSTSTSTSTATATSTGTPGATGTPGPTEPSLPNSGSSWPTIVGAGLGILVILGSLLLAL